MGKPAALKIVLALLGHIQNHHPPVIVFELLVPFFIIAIVAAMKVEHVFRNENEFVDAMVEKDIGHIPSHRHDIILDRIVPFAQQFYDGIMLFVISKKDLHV